jgi:hypothetical protein
MYALVMKWVRVTLALLAILIGGGSLYYALVEIPANIADLERRAQAADFTARHPADVSRPDSATLLDPWGRPMLQEQLRRQAAQQALYDGARDQAINAAQSVGRYNLEIVNLNGWRVVAGFLGVAAVIGGCIGVYLMLRGPPTLRRSRADVLRQFEKERTPEWNAATQGTAPETASDQPAG